MKRDEFTFLEQLVSGDFAEDLIIEKELGREARVINIDNSRGTTALDITTNLDAVGKKQTVLQVFPNSYGTIPFQEKEYAVKKIKIETTENHNFTIEFFA